MKETLTLLDLSAAFDTVDHAILLHRLEQSYGVCGSAHDWFAAFLYGCTVCPLRINKVSSKVTLVRRAAGVGPRADPFPAVHS